MKQCKELVINAENYTNPPIPDGYKYVEGEWHNGFVIEKISDGSQFVWIPVGSIDSTKLGALKIWFITICGEKYGGFYISRYNISKSLNGKPQSIQGEYPWTNITFKEAKAVAESMEKSENIRSMLTGDTEYELVLKWLLDSNIASYRELYIDSSHIGNYSRYGYWNEVAKTGSRKEWCLNGIYDFAGNVREWVDWWKPITRGGAYNDIGITSGYNDFSGAAAFRYVSEFPDFYASIFIGFRVILFLM